VAERPQELPDVCALADDAAIDEALATEIGRRYAEAIEPMSDARGTARYRRRVIAVEVRRAVLEVAA
jgi:carbon-monoxide dehydrogenase medium subunit